MRRLTFIVFSIALIFVLTTSAYAKVMTIIVQPFANDGAAQYAWLSAGMTSTVISDLGTFKEIRLITESDRKRALSELELSQSGMLDPDELKKFGKFLNADLILTGSFMVSGQKVRVNARIIKIETGQIEKTLKVDGTMDGIFEVQDKIVLGLMENAGQIKLEGVTAPKIAEQEKKKLADKPRPTLSAYELYSKGLVVEYTDPHEALSFFKQALDIEPEYVDPLIQAGFLTGSMFNLFDEGLGYMQKADSLLRKRGETKNQAYADLMTYIGIVYSGKGSYDTALEFYNRAQVLYQQLGLQKNSGYSALLQNIGNIHQNRNNYDEALKFALEAKSIDDELNNTDTNNYGSILQCIGNAYQSKQEYDKALEYYRLSKAKYEKLGLAKTTNFAMLANNIGNVYYGKGDLGKTIENYTIAKKIYENLGQQKTVAYGHLMYGFALAYERQEKKDKAGKAFRDAYNAYEAAGYIDVWKQRALENAQRLGE